MNLQEPARRPNARRCGRGDASRRRTVQGRPRERLNRARGNLARAKVPVPGGYLEDLCFDARQACEKAIEAVLITRRIDLPYTHDLSYLLTTLEPPHPSSRSWSPREPGNSRPNEPGPLRVSGLTSFDPEDTLPGTINQVGHSQSRFSSIPPIRYISHFALRIACSCHMRPRFSQRLKVESPPDDWFTVTVFG